MTHGDKTREERPRYASNSRAGTDVVVLRVVVTAALYECLP